MPSMPSTSPSPLSYRESPVNCPRLRRLPHHLLPGFARTYDKYDNWCPPRQTRAQQPDDVEFVALPRCESSAMS